MAWVNDLASSAGIPAGAATLAVAMYAACTAAEKAARPEALKDIGRILQDPSWSRSVRPSAIIQRVFVWTFGERHLSWRCITRSVLASLLLIISLTLTYYAIFGVKFAFLYELVGTYDYQKSNVTESWFGSTPLSLLQTYIVSLGAGLFLMALLPDYLSLAKTRLLIHRVGYDRGILSTAMLVATDIALSAAVSSLLFLVTSTLAAYLWQAMRSGYDNPPYVYPILFLISGHYNTPYTIFAEIMTIDDPHHFSPRWLAYMIFSNMAGPFVERGTQPSFVIVFFSSTLFTSVWTILILLSTTVLKLLAPVHRFTAWFFDVEKHPVQAIGIVAGALVMIGSLIWTVLRAVF
jgi:hypothetical protein